jgi:hypothetical protein
VNVDLKGCGKMDLLRQFKSKHGENKAIIAFQETEHTGTEADIQKTKPSEIASPDIPETPPAPIGAAEPVIMTPEDTITVSMETLKHGGDLSKWKVETISEDSVRCPLQAGFGLPADNHHGTPSTGLSPTITTPTEVDSIAETTDKENHVTERTIGAAPTIQEVDQRENELDELILQLRAVGRSHKLEWGRGKKVPMKALLHAASLWLSLDPDDWTAANDTIFQFTSPFGNKQICYRRSEKVAIPEIGGKHGT